MQLPFVYWFLSCLKSTNSKIVILGACLAIINFFVLTSEGEEGLEEQRFPSQSSSKFIQGVFYNTNKLVCVAIRL